MHTTKTQVLIYKEEKPKMVNDHLPQNHPSTHITSSNTHSEKEEINEIPQKNVPQFNEQQI